MLHLACGASRLVRLLLSLPDPVDKLLSECVDRLRDTLGLGKKALMILGNFGMQQSLRRRASPGVDGLVVIPCQNEMVRLTAPFPNESQLHRVEVLRFIGND